MTGLFLFFALVPVGLVAAALAAGLLADRRALRAFCQHRAGERFLLWDTRDGWHEFIENNVLPALPGVTASARGRHRRTNARYDREVWRHLPWWSLGDSGRVPLLVVVEPDGLRVHPLRALLEPLREKSARCPAVAAQVGARLSPTLRALPQRQRGAAGGALTPAAAPAAR